jgi:glycerol-3-phosphate dehydrogenase
MKTQPIFRLDTRATFFEQLRARPFDLAVIGGGITGAGIARDAAMRGLSVALVEKQDFAGGTSSNSGRIIHGGLRYIESLQFGVVHQACAERRIVHALAPHLVSPLPSVIPLPQNRKQRLKLRAGLLAYDAAALYRNIHLSEHLTAAGMVLAEPSVAARGQHDGIRYWERTVDDARLTLSTIQSACRHGALALNYAEVISLLKAHGRVAGVGVRDVLTGRTFELRAAQVVNATGPWNDLVRAMDEPGTAPSVRPNKGIHIAVAHAAFPIAGQVNFAAIGEKRMLYAIPWRTTSLIGTTDTDYTGELETVHALRDEVAWLLESVNHAFVDTALTAADVVSTFAGLRPLVQSQEGVAYRASREHHITHASSGLISIAGGKLTTHRAMAKDVVDLVASRLRRGLPCRTNRVPLDAGISNEHDLNMLIKEAHASAPNLDQDVLHHLVFAYGSQSPVILEMAAQDSQLRRRIVPGLPYLYAEILYAIHHEMACTLSDVLIRRTRLIHETPDQALPLATSIAALIGQSLGWNANEHARQVRAYADQVALTRRFDPSWKLPEEQEYA